MKIQSTKIPALALMLAVSLTTFAFPVTAAAAENEPAYTYKTYEGKSTKKVTVSDAYKKDYTTTLEYGNTKAKVKIRIPKITISGVNTKAINNKIYKYCKAHTGGDKYSQTGCTYNYCIGKEFISLRVIFDQNDGYTGYTSYQLYNISKKTGKKMSTTGMLKALKISKSKFKARVKKSVIKAMSNDTEFEYGPYLYNRNISDEKLNKAVPFVTSKGKLGYMLPMFEIPAGSGYTTLFGSLGKI